MMEIEGVIKSNEKFGMKRNRLGKSQRGEGLFGFCSLIYIDEGN